MHYIDEMYPLKVIDFEKYCTYLELRKEREKFIKSLSNKRSCDWLIEKKLLDAGGLGDHVYLYLARGQNRQRSMEEYLRHVEAGRDVTIVNAKDAFVKPFTRRDVIIDKDLLEAEHWFNERLNAEVQKCLYEEICKRSVTDWTNNYLDPVYKTEWKPIIAPDAYIYHPKYGYDYVLCPQMLYSGFKVVQEELERLVEDVQ
jgi:hypothetical protein